MGTDGVNSNKVKVAITSSPQSASTSSISGGKVNINESSYFDLITNPTSNEISTMDNSYSALEANNMNEQGFAVGYNGNTQNIQTVSGTGNTSVPTGRAEATLAASGNTLSYNGHTHGGVIKYDPSMGNVSVGGSVSSAGDRSGSTHGRPNVVLGYDVQSNTGEISAGDIANAPASEGKYVPLNPANFNKTITFYNQYGDMKMPNYITFKSNVNSINRDYAVREGARAAVQALGMF